MRSNLIVFGFVYVVLGEEASKKSDEKESISCYTCGLEEIDPELDKEGSYGDERHAFIETRKNNPDNRVLDLTNFLIVKYSHSEKCRNLIRGEHFS